MPSASTPIEEPSTPAVPSDLPGEPQPIFEADCDTMTVGLDNPADGIEFNLKFATSKGEERTPVIKPGEKKSETFSAKPGFSIKQKGRIDRHGRCAPFAVHCDQKSRLATTASIGAMALCRSLISNGTQRP